MACNNIDVTADKIVFVSGDKTTALLGEKGGNSSTLTGTADKSVLFFAEKGGSNILGSSDKTIYLTGEKIVYLTGSTDKIMTLIGSKSKIEYLQADGACVGWWYILVDSTLFTVDNMMITVDRSPV